MQILKLKKKILPVLRKYHIKRAGIFGSYARGEQKKKSDVDILILPPHGLGLGFIRIESELEKVLDTKVDLLSYNGINPRLKNKILKDEVRIL
ncbi:nucleotidyltransferase family protein [Candidatus Woesearchaeota archaeon]|nr:nucleotidyltransferase family protein [Candidatus Woesearchaeota archaeon]